MITDLPIIERERLLRVAREKGHAPSLVEVFAVQQPHTQSAYRELADELAEEFLVHPALVYGIMLSAITTFYVALTEQIKANESEKVH